MNEDTSTHVVENMARCLVFADSDAGIAETQSMLRMLATERDSQRHVIGDLAMLVRKLAYSLNKPNGNSLLAREAIDYLRRHNLQGSILRTPPVGVSP